MAVVDGFVDSGATRSMLPVSIAERLGIRWALEADAIPGTAVTGEEFPTFSYRQGILNAQIAVDLPVPHFWGPKFNFNPGFAEFSGRMAGLTVLGRADFFRRFFITFEEHGEGGILELEERTP